MSRRAALVLLAAAGWTLFVWLIRIGNVLDSGRSAGFKTVHVVLAAVSVGFGFAIATIGWRRLRRP